MLEAVACCLSGGGTRLVQERLADEFEKLGVAYKVFIANDSIAAILTAFENGLSLYLKILKLWEDNLISYFINMSLF